MRRLPADPLKRTANVDAKPKLADSHDDDREGRFTGHPALDFGAFRGEQARIYADTLAKAIGELATGAPPGPFTPLLPDKWTGRGHLHSSPLDRGEVGRGVDRDALSIVIPDEGGNPGTLTGAPFMLLTPAATPTPALPLQGGGRTRGTERSH